MNIFRAAYCRCFQIAFRIALPLLPYREPKPLDSCAEAADVLKEKAIDSVLLVTDSFLYQNGLTKNLENALRERNIACTVYSEVVPNPTIQNVEEARKLYLNNHCSAIIGLGGGSAMDCAKACGARIVKPKQSVPKMRGILKIHRRTPLTIAIPTTAGTGSEATLAAVITDPETKHKYPVNDFPLIPDYAVLDPELTVNLPQSITATTGMDALTHAVEAYIGRSTNKFTRAMSEEATTLIYQNLYEAYANGQNLDARRAMLRAAYCAGVSFTRSYVGYVHGVAHSLGGQYRVAHGLANAVILPYFLDEYGSSVYKKLGRLSRKCNISSADTDDETAAKEFIAWVKKMNASMNIPTSIPEIQECDIPVMAKHADAESNPLYPVPVLMDRKALEQMYRKLMPNKE